MITDNDLYRRAIILTSSYQGVDGVIIHCPDKRTEYSLAYFQDSPDRLPYLNIRPHDVRILRDAGSTHLRIADNGVPPFFSTGALTDPIEVTRVLNILGIRKK